MKVSVPEGTAFVYDARGVEYQIDSRRQVEVNPLHAQSLQFVMARKSGKVTDIQRDESGRMTGYTEDGVAYTVTYNGSGDVVAVVGGGVTRAFSYAADKLTGVSVQ